MTKIIVAFLLIGLSAKSQRITYGFADTSMKVRYHERIVKDTICQDCVVDYKKGNIPTKYYWVEYIFNEPPSYFEIMNWYWTGFPETYNGWKITVKEEFYIHGFTEGIKLIRVIEDCDTCDYLKRYCDDVYLTYGYEDKAALKVQQNKDTTDKYMKMEYPSLYPDKPKKNH